MSEPPVLIVDNGAGFLKIGLSTQDKPFIYPNCIARSKKDRTMLLVGDSIQSTMKTHDLTYYRPFDRGCAANWDVESAIWKRILSLPTSSSSPSSLPAPATTPPPPPTKKKARLTSVDDEDLYFLRGSLTPLETFRDAGLVYTEPPFCPETYRKAAFQTFFEELEFGSVYSCLADTLALRHHFVQHPELLTKMGGCGRRAAMVVDSGFSFTHIVPFSINLDCTIENDKKECDNNVSSNENNNNNNEKTDKNILGMNISGIPCFIDTINRGIRRVDVGGKILTNVLKEAISFRQWNMMDEVSLVNNIKERTGFVSLNIEEDLQSPPTVDYVLPDYVSSNVGQIVDKTDVPRLKKEGRQLLPLGVERFSVPEALFNPSDIDIEQCGIVDATVDAIAASVAHDKKSGDDSDSDSDDDEDDKRCNINLDLYDHLCSCILLRGGSTLFKNFAERFEKDLNPYLLSGTPLSVFASSDPVADAWLGGRDLVMSGDYGRLAVKRSDYEEYGVDYLLKKHKI